MAITINFIQLDGSSQAVTVEDLSQTVMQVARNNDIDGIAADCGGACACATCHVHVDPAWMEIVGAPSAVEEDMLNLSSEPVETSRLSCQIELSEALDGLRVTIAQS
jgi:2Fe-2S ferredoxin